MTGEEDDDVAWLPIATAEDGINEAVFERVQAGLMADAEPGLREMFVEDFGLSEQQIVEALDKIRQLSRRVGRAELERGLRHLRH
jgi:hypothetical protein